MKSTTSPKIALVCDWLTNIGGAERVLLSLHELYPDAPIYTSQYNRKGITWFKGADVRTGWLQILPSRLRRFLGPLRQLYFSHLDLSEYDVIISVTGAEAKSVRFDPIHTTHLCYCHVPTQYYWQMYNEYIKNPGFGILNPLVRLAVKLLVRPLRRADFRAASRPTTFLTISTYAASLIQKYYKREATIIHPPVNAENFGGEETVAGSVPYFITTSRQVTWKRIDLAIKACLKTHENLLIIGSGPEHKNLQKLAAGSPYIKFLPEMPQQDLAKYLRSAKGYLFPSKEPFGIAPVEALAAGCPVIAFAEGGSRDYIIDGQNGLLFPKQTAASLAAAITKFNAAHFDRKKIPATATRFSDARFKREIEEVVARHVKD